MTTVQNFLVQSERNKKNTRHDEIKVDVDASKVFEKLFEIWAETVNNSRSAPTWSKVMEIQDQFQKQQAFLDIATDEDTRGAIEFKFNSIQKDLVNQLFELFRGSSSRAGVPQNIIHQASEKCEDFMKSLQHEIGFEKDGQVHMKNFMEQMGPFFTSIIHPQYGQITLQSLELMAKTPAPKPESLTEEEMDASTVPAHLMKTKSGKPIFASMGQMVKAKAADSLEEYIQGRIDEQEKNPSSKAWVQSERQEDLDKLLYHASKESSLDCVKVLVNLGKATLNFADNDGLNAFHLACKNNQSDISDFIINKFKMDVNAFNTLELTPLMFAAQHDAVDVMELLLHKHKANMEEKALDGRTALHYACIGVADISAYNSVLALIQAGADPTVEDLTDEANYPECYIDTENDELYEKLKEYRKNFEQGIRVEKVEKTIDSVRSKLGF